MWWKKKKRRVWPIILLSLILLVTAIRIYTPYALKTYLEKTVNRELPNHHFSIGKLELSLLTLNYRLRDVQLTREKRGDSLMKVGTFIVQVHPFSMLSKVILDQVNLEFRHDEESFGKIGGGSGSNRGWFETIRVVTLGHLQELIIKNSSIHYRGVNPKEEHFYLDHVAIRGSHLYRTQKGDNFSLGARFMGKSDLKVWGRVNVQKENPEIKLKAKFEKYPLAHMNFFFEKYAHYQINKGEALIYSEIEVKDEKLLAYVKPFVSELKGEELKGDESKQFSKKFQMALKILSSKFLKDDKTQSVATFIPIKADAKDIDVDISKVLKAGLKHAFGDSIPKGFEK